MEKIGPDVQTVLSPSPKITSTFNVNVQELPPRSGLFGPSPFVETGYCGLGWRFRAERDGAVPTSPGASAAYRVRISFVPGLLDMNIARNIRVELSYSSSSAYSLGTWTMHLDVPFTIHLSVSLLNLEMPRIVAPLNHDNSLISRLKLQDTLHKALKGETSFADVKFSLYSRREKGQKVGGQRFLHGNSELLLGFNDYVDSLLKKATSIKESSTTLSSEDSNYDKPITVEAYGYESDSDLESEWEDDESISPALDHGDDDTLSISSLGTGEHVDVSAVSTEDAEKKETTDPRLLKASSAPVIHVSDTAAKTWEVLLYYMYTGEIEFQPLTSQDLSPAKSTRACSPKAMYRLADKIGMNELKDLCKEQIRKSLNEHNIVTEVSSLFTSRYEDIKQMQVELLLESFLWSAQTRADLDTLMEAALMSEKTHARGVLSLIFHRQSVSYAQKSSKFEGQLPGPVPIPAQSADIPSIVEEPATMLASAEQPATVAIEPAPMDNPVPPISSIEDQQTKGLCSKHRGFRNSKSLATCKNCRLRLASQ